MRNRLKITVVGLAVLGFTLRTPSVQAAKKASTEEQVAVLLQWYHTYFEEGKYKQAEQVAALAYEFAPEDPKVAAARKLSQHQQVKTVSTTEVEVQLEKVLLKLDRMEHQLRSMEERNRRRTLLQIVKEPPGSPDAYSPYAE